LYLIDCVGRFQHDAATTSFTIANTLLPSLAEIDFQQHSLSLRSFWASQSLPISDAVGVVVPNASRNRGVGLSVGSALRQDFFLKAAPADSANGPVSIIVTNNSAHCPGVPRRAAPT
jgi:hypothetical protein